MMKYLTAMHKLKLFHKRDIVALVGDDNAAKELLRQYGKRGLIVRIRRDYYSVTDLASKAAMATKYEIASQVTPTSCLSHHAALEYHGWANQVFYELAVSSNERFNSFQYEGITYRFCEHVSDVGVVVPPMDSLIRVTDAERTIIDCINRIDLSGGLEELIAALSLVTLVDENKMSLYLAELSKQNLYQKIGFILSHFREEMKLSTAFIEHCRSKIGKSTGYLTNTQESNTYFKEWRLCAPQNILSYLEQGGNINV